MLGWSDFVLPVYRMQLKEQHITDKQSQTFEALQKSCENAKEEDKVGLNEIAGVQSRIAVMAALHFDFQLAL